MSKWAKILKATCLFICVASAQECPCELQTSEAYEGTLKWNCQGHGLISVPTQCFDQSDNVTELILTSNIIESINADDFAQLPLLRSLYLDTNKIESFDPTTLEKIQDLEIFNIAQNPNLKFPKTALTSDKKLQEIYFISSHISVLPDISASPKLTTLDARSCWLTTLPRPLFGSLESDNFYLNLVGNNFVDVAADILLPIPNFSIINLDSYVIIWAMDVYQYYDVLNKQWKINLDLNLSLKVCYYDGNPEDPAMC